MRVGATESPRIRKMRASAETSASADVPPKMRAPARKSSGAQSSEK